MSPLNSTKVIYFFKQYQVHFAFFFELKDLHSFSTVCWSHLSEMDSVEEEEQSKTKNFSIQVFKTKLEG